MEGRRVMFPTTGGKKGGKRKKEGGGIVTRITTSPLLPHLPVTPPPSLLSLLVDLFAFSAEVGTCTETSSLVSYCSKKKMFKV